MEFLQIICSITRFSFTEASKSMRTCKKNYSRITFLLTQVLYTIFYIIVQKTLLILGSEWPYKSCPFIDEKDYNRWEKVLSSSFCACFYWPF
jgi:hypothetical protein